MYSGYRRFTGDYDIRYASYCSSLPYVEDKYVCDSVEKLSFFEKLFRENLVQKIS